MVAIVIRAEEASDIAPIHQVITAAFADVVLSNHQEALLVDELRKHGALEVSLVGECDSQIVGHIAFSPVTVDRTVCFWFGLAPLAVLPLYQRNGIGTRLINAGLESLRVIGAEGCVVLGEPEYYGRFGFVARDELILENVPPHFFLSQSFSGKYPRGTIHYHGAFELCG